MTFASEKEFEKALIDLLFTKGWEQKVLVNPTEEDLVANWANILFENNCGQDRLNHQPLTKGEMAQILEQINLLKTPLKLNGFINGKTVSIKRDNPNDKLHFGKEVSLKIYDRQEIAAGQSRYQIAVQPIFKTNPILNDRRGDLMFLINGMPVFHVELKRSGIPVSQAVNQIEKYSYERVFTGLYSLVQIFVAMTPEETLYFANVGTDGKFNPDFYFHWADFNNEQINDWQKIATYLISIPMAHQLIGFYTVADNNDGILKVMRSYQYYAANAISDKVRRNDWKIRNQLGGYIWHTTGSGKTMTSFKSAQLIASSKDADKVIFLLDRIELGTQSLSVYEGFKSDNEEIQPTENTNVLTSKLTSDKSSDTLIITSIQKMSRIQEDGMKQKDLDKIMSKRIVVIVDECHRSTFGDMLINIKNTFPNAMFFGFTGTPIQEENEKKGNTTATLFGNELHRYSIADGIRDKNVLGFDPYKIETFKATDLRKAVALKMCNAATPEEAISDPKKAEVYYEFMKMKMAGFCDKNGNYIKGIEDFVPISQYQLPQHQEKVIEDILSNWVTLSRNNKFHGILATSSIKEAIEYYRLIKSKNIGLKVTALFDPNIDNTAGFAYKEDGLVEIITDYNARYKTRFTIPTHDRLKKDMANRLAHKELYKNIAPRDQIDLLIVVDQMLTGFDSKWLNTLYIDKMLGYANIIQAFSRTNRLFGQDKPFGVIRYYRKPNTMQNLIADAVKLYSGEKKYALFVDKLPDNINALNYLYGEIKNIFTYAEIENFEKLPNEIEAKQKFAKLFKRLSEILEAAKIQGLKWTDERLVFGEKEYLILALRYKELFTQDGGGTTTTEVSFDIVGYLTEINTDKIDIDYMNLNFNKYLKALKDYGSNNNETKKALAELHKTFATLSQDEQKYAEIFLHDVERGDIVIDANKTLKEYIIEYKTKAGILRIHNFATAFGLDENSLTKIISSQPNEANINEFGRLDHLKSSANKTMIKQYFESKEQTTFKPFELTMKFDELLRKFILLGGTFEI